MTSPSPSPSASKESSPEPTESEQIKAKEATKSSESGSESEVKESDTPETKAGDEEATSATPATATSSTPWQAIFSPQYNAYYFHNSETQETTWQNPLASSSDSSNAVAGPSSESEQTTSTSSPASSQALATEPTSSYSALQAAALAQGIDPSLAYLDPTLASVPGTSSVGYGATARFNARTGQFARPDGRDPSHLSEYERMKRMSEFYFDVNAWEQQRALQNEEEETEGKKRKRPSKKDVERFKEQKRQKKIAKTAWLRT
ncbi:hypothetical protein WG66_016190 [Moniliophthora roreri]|uniref:WW domain-containing protein n=1 Tax=Moniliophthora roreri TaxID=221103 RepID=A0A0W0F2Z3_MONRR|nr:hypothetical protein WG66_016190 [Moniliophthora roreri]